MKMFNKKMLAGLVAGAMLMTGSAILVNNAYAADSSQPPAFSQDQNQNRPPRFNLNDAAARLAQECNVDASQIVSYCNDGGDFREAMHAAHLAKLSGKSFNTVVNAKTDSNNWQQVAESLGVTQEMMDQDRRDFMAQRIADMGNVSQDDAKRLLDNGYDGRDIEMAGALAKASSKNIDDVLGMKKLNNSWRDVATELGIDDSTLQSLRPAPPEGQPNQQNFGRHHRGYDNDDRGPGYHHGDGYPGDCPRN